VLTIIGFTALPAAQDRRFLPGKEPNCRTQPGFRQLEWNSWQGLLHGRRPFGTFRPILQGVLGHAEARFWHAPRLSFQRYPWRPDARTLRMLCVAIRQSLSRVLGALRGEAFAAIWADQRNIMQHHPGQRANRYRSGRGKPLRCVTLFPTHRRGSAC
jgi:hypothetical protein